VRSDLTAEDARRAMLALLAMGLDADREREPGTAGMWQVSVAEDEVAAALPLVNEDLTADLAEEAAPSAPVPPVLGDTEAGIWTWEHSTGSLVIALVCIGLHVTVHGGAGPSPRSTMLAAPWLVHDGEWWRLLTAAFLHFDIKHLVGNMSALFFLGPPLGSTIGQIPMVALFVLTAVAGNLVSQVLGNDAALKAGASGGVCGLLGALAGVALVAMAAATDARERRPAWQTLGALVALFGMMVGFEPGSDHYAHLGGLASGVVLGRLLVPRARVTEP
jgi:membrane associated rhomboid family serine protease